jgi:hypothetical protein
VLQLRETVPPVRSGQPLSLPRPSVRHVQVRLTGDPECGRASDAQHAQKSAAEASATEDLGHHPAVEGVGREGVALTRLERSTVFAQPSW